MLLYHGTTSTSSSKRSVVKSSWPSTNFGAKPLEHAENLAEELADYSFKNPTGEKLELHAVIDT